MSQNWTPPPPAGGSATVPNYLVPAIISIFCCWPMFAAVKNLILINYARDQLQRRFRIAATERFNEAEKESESLLPALPRRPAPRLPPVLPR